MTGKPTVYHKDRTPPTRKYADGRSHFTPYDSWKTRSSDSSISSSSGTSSALRFFALTIAGNAMNNKGILDGATVIIDTELSPHQGDIVAVEIQGELTIRQLQYEGHYIRLTSAHQGYPDILLSDAAVVNIFGVAIASYHPQQSFYRTNVSDPKELMLS